MRTLASPGSSLAACAARGVLALSALGGLMGCPATTTPHVGVAVEETPHADTSGADRAALTIHYGSSACAGGSLVAAKVMVGERVVAEVAPASEAVVEVPIGPVRVVAGDAVTTLEVAKAGAHVALGCDAAAFAGAPLQPLTLVAPEARCTDLPALHVKAGGLEHQLVRGERWTILVPRGGHVVRFGVGADDHRSIALTIDDGGKELALAPGCVVLESAGPADSALAPDP